MMLYFLISFFAFSLPTNDRLKPPGSVQIAENLFVDQNEITVSDWKEFEYYTLSEEENTIRSNSEIVNRLHITNFPASYDYPLDYISFEEAKAYCQWRTDLINNAYLKEEDYLIVYRLPTEEEFRLMIQHGSTIYSKRAEKVRGELPVNNSEGDLTRYFPYNKKRVGKFNRVRGYKKNGIFGLFSNAAEMSSEKGVAYGMTNQNFNPVGNPMTKTLYDGPSKWVGFRCVAEYVNK